MKTDSKLMSIESNIHFENDREDIVVDTWNVYTSNNVLSAVFGKNKKDFDNYNKKKKVIKITSLDTNKSIYRIWNGAPIGAKSKDLLYLDKNAKYDLLSDKNVNSVNIVFSKGSKLKFYLNHYDHMVRVSYKLGFWSVIVGGVSFIIGSISLIIGIISLFR